MLLSDEEILHRVDTHVGEPNQKYPLNGSDWKNFARAIEAAILARLAGSELPPLPAYECGPHTGHAAVSTDESIRAYGLQARAQGFAAGAAAQLSAEPSGFIDKYGEIFAEVEQMLSTDTPLYTRREA